MPSKLHSLGKNWQGTGGHSCSRHGNSRWAHWPTLTRGLPASLVLPLPIKPLCFSFRQSHFIILCPGWLAVFASVPWSYNHGRHTIPLREREIQPQGVTKPASGLTSVISIICLMQTLNSTFHLTSLFHRALEVTENKGRDEIGSTLEPYCWQICLFLINEL